MKEIVAWSKLILIFICVWISSSCSKPSDNTQSLKCANLEMLGKNNAQVNELLIWFEEKWTDQSFKDLFNQTTDIYALGNPQLFSKVDLGWSKYGINRNLASISISGKPSEIDIPLWVSFGEGRNALYVELDGASKLSDTAEKSDRWKVIKEGIYLFCEKD